MKISIQIRTIVGTALGLLAFYGVAAGDESAGGDSVVAFEDSFERSELGDPWSIIIPSFSIEDGRLIGREVPERNHTSISRVPLAFRNGVFEFSFRLVDAEGLHFVINDQNCEEAHSGHICRVSFSPTQVKISDDRDGAFRKDLYQAFRDSGRTTKRIFIDTSIPFSFDSEQWYKARINLIDDQMKVMIDGTSIGSFRSPGIAHPTKTDIGFVTKGNIVEIDDVRVSNIGDE
ncbi:hypothetical protein N8787_05665 [Opitutaceae bacterium]|nr:hypothetical protein [Opitutaceae bacterium]